MTAFSLHFTTSSFPSLTKSNLHRSLSSFYRSLKISMSHNQSYWASINAEVEAYIEGALSGRQPASVFEPMNHLVFAAAKSMGPALCVAACEAVGGRRDQAMEAASALHVMHAAAFTHENLPFLDQPRPNFKPRAHHVFDANVELLISDGILPFGYELLAGSDDPNGENSEQILRLIIEIARTMGPQGMVDGQYIQMQRMRSDGDEMGEVKWVHHVSKKKEGEFYACGASCGAILGGGSDEEIEKLRKIGFYIGMIHGIMMHGVGTEEKELLQVVQGFRCLALKELESLQDKNVDTIKSLMDGLFPMNQAGPSMLCLPSVSYV